MDSTTAAYWIDHLNLQPHPEGGYYKEVFRSDIAVSRLSSPKTSKACTSIYYLLQGEDFSTFHRIASDELWYFHKGSPLHIHLIDLDGNYSANELSDQPGGSLSFAVKAGAWFASALPSAKGFSLVSCAVAPGFEFSEFEIGKKQDLLLLFPQHALLFNKLCR